MHASTDGGDTSSSAGGGRAATGGGDTAGGGTSSGGDDPGGGSDAKTTPGSSGSGDASGSGDVADRDGATLRLKQGGVFYAPGELTCHAVKWPRLVAGTRSGQMHHLMVEDSLGC